MFQFTPFPSCRLCIHLPIPEHYLRCVPAFGHPRIFRYVLLPAAFRSLSRPSSAPSAKAFTLCPYSLDLILVLSFIEIVVSTSQLFFLKKTCLVLYFLPLCSFQFCAFLHDIQFFRFMVGLGGLEPPTSRLSGVRSNHLSYKPMLVSGDGRRFFVFRRPVVEMRRIELLTPCLQGRCSPS